MVYAFWALMIGLSAASLWLAYRGQKLANSDEIFAGLTPGLAPTDGEAGTRVPVGGEYSGEIAVAFNPPKGVRAGLAGTIVDGKAETRDVTATIVDLAARGFLTIRVVESSATRTGRDWELTRNGGATGPLEPGESHLLDDLFVLDSTVLLSELPRHRNHAFNNAQHQLATECAERGWFRLGSQGQREKALAMLGVVAVIVIALTAGIRAGLALAVLVAIAGWGMAMRSSGRPPRSAEGTAVRIQSLGFKKYLATAEKEQFSYEEAAGVFSKYLPYAIVFGVADHWTKVFGDLAAQAELDGFDGGFDLFWLSMYGWGMSDAMVDLGMFGALGDGADFGGDWFGTEGIDGLGADASGLDAGLDPVGIDAGGDAGGDSWGGFGGEGGGWGDFGGGGDFGGFGGD